MPKGEKTPAAPRGEARSYLASIVESSDDAIIGKKTDGTITSWNPAARRIYGYSAGEAIGRNVSILAPPDRKDEMPEILRRIRKGERIAHYETIRIRKDGRKIDVSLTVSPIKDARGRIVGASTIARDITERKRAEEELHESERKLKGVLESAPVGIAISTPDKKILEANPAVCEMFGYTREEFIKQPTLFYFPDPRDEERLLGGLLEKGFVKDFEARVRRRDGSVFWVSATSTAQKDREGKTQFITITSDITKRKQIEEQARAASLYSRSLIEASLDPLVTISPDGKITDVNKATEQVTGVKRIRLIGSDFSDYFTEPEKARAGYKKVLSEGFVRDYPLAIKHKSGRVTDVLYNATTYTDEKGRIQGVFAAARDITERKMVEEQLRAASLYERSLIEASIDPLVTIGPDGKITDVSKATEQVTGVPRGRLIGTDFSRYFTEPEKARRGYKQVFEKGFVKDYPLSIRHKSGKVTDVLYNATVYKSEEGKVIGVFAAARDITERKRVEERLQESEKKFRSLVESIPVGIAVTTPKGEIIEVNTTVLKVFGYTKEEFEKLPASAVYHDPKARERFVEELLKKGKVADFEAKFKRKDGSVFWGSITTTSQKTASGKTQFLNALLDITERKRAAEKLRAASSYARSLIEASLDPLVTISPDGKITDVNDATEMVTGIPRDRLIGSDFSEYFTEPDKARAGYKQVLSQGFVRDYPLSILHKSGKVTDVLYNATLYRDEAGKVTGVFAAARDITKRKRAEEQLHAASLYARSLIEASIDPLVTIGPDGRITDVNRATEMVTGAPRDGLIGTDFSRYFTEPEKARRGYKQVFAQGFVRDYPLSIRHTSGRITDVLYNATIYKDEAGNVKGVFAAARDITERKVAEERLRESEEKYRTIFENTGTAMATIEEDTTISTVNTEFEKLSGYAKSEVEGRRSWAEFAAKEDAARMMEYHRLRRIDPTLAPRSYEFRFVTKGGELRNAFLTIDLIPGTKKSVASISDVTKLKQAEAQLTEEKKKVEALLALKDEFIIDIGHELKTPLSIILGNLTLLRGIAPPEREREWLGIVEMLERNSVRLGGSIDKILELYKIGTAEIKKERVEIHEVLEDVYREQVPLAKLRGLKFEIQVEPVAIIGDGSLLKLALSNLVNNAIKFTNRGGVNVALRPLNGNVAISVSDTGIGISPDNQKRLFEKFFKADPSAPGTGIGLAITKEIMDKHGGEIKVTSSLGKGSTFELILPRRE